MIVWNLDRTTLFFIAITGHVVAVLGQSIDPYSEGAYGSTVRHVRYRSYVFSPQKYQLDVWAPNVASTFPVVVFQGGNAGERRVYGLNKATHMALRTLRRRTCHLCWELLKQF